MVRDRISLPFAFLSPFWNHFAVANPFLALLVMADKNYISIRLGVGAHKIAEPEKHELEKCAQKYQHWLKDWVKDGTDSGLTPLMVSQTAADLHMKTLAILDRTSHHVPPRSSISRVFEQNTIYMIIPFAPR